MCLPDSSSPRRGRGDRSSSSSPSALPCGCCRRSPASCCRCSSHCCWPRCSHLRPHGWSRRECPAAGRSEEHTSELQSRGHLVCRLLLEKINESDGILAYVS